MSWLKIDDGFTENEKIAGLTDRAFRVHLTALCFCARNLTDGYLTTKSVRIIAALLGVPVKRAVEDLVAADLWLRTAYGYVINDYLEFNPSAAKVKADRKSLSEARSQAGKKGAAARWGNGGNPDGNGDGKTEIVSMAPSRPLKEQVPRLKEPASQTRKNHGDPGIVDFAAAAQLAQARRQEASV